jgi:hypothetical protein
LAFANHERKKSIVRAIKSSDVDYAIFKKWLDDANEQDLFDPEQLAELAQLSDEDKDKLVQEEKEKREQLFKQGYAFVRPSTIAGVIRKHPKAWTMQERRMVDYASVLISKGLIELSGWSDEQIEVLK